MLRESSKNHIQQSDGVMLFEFRPDMVMQVSQLYRDFAILCIERQVRRVLIKAGCDDPLGERSLRNALTTMVLAGLPSEFRIAVVAESVRIAAKYRDTARDLCMVGIDAKIFDSEAAAGRWLRGYWGGALTPK